MSFVSNWLTPIIKVLFFIGFFGFFSFIILKAIHNGWSKRYKFVIKYKIFRRKYPEKKVEWCLECLDQNLSYHDVKKFLMVKSIPKKIMNETLWIYSNLLKELKGGVGNERKIKGISNEVTTKQNIPKYSTEEIPRD